MEKLNESLSVYFVGSYGFKIGTKNLAGFYIDVCKANEIGLKGGKPSTYFFVQLTRTMHNSRPSS